MDNEKAIRAAKLTLGGILEKRRAQDAKDRAPGQIAPSKYLPDVPRQVHANGGYVPTAGLPIPRLAVARPLSVGQQQPSFFDAIGSLASIGKTAKGIKDLVSPSEEPAEPAQEPQAARAEPHEGGSMSPEASAAMEALRGSWKGQDFGIESAYRDPETNQRVKGAKGSQHLHGNAYDVNTTGWSPEDKLALADQAWNAGFRGFGFYDNNMHFDVADPRAWGPDYHRGSIPEWAQPWAENRYGYADGGEVADLGQAREAKQLQGFHTGMMGDISDAASERMEVHQKALDAGVFDGYEMGDVLQGKNAPMKITGRFVRPWKPSRATLEHFDRMGAKPTIIEHNGKQYIPMLRTLTGVKGTEDWQEGDAYLDGVKAMGYPKMGGLRAVKAAGGAAMFEGIHPDLQDEQGNPKELWHGTPGEPFDEFKDEKIGRRDPGFYGRGHYLTAQRGNAEAYADPEEMQRGSVMGPLHAALKNPFVWDASSPESLHRTMRKLQDFGVMGGKDRLDPWDALKPHEIDQFMQSAVANGHDGVIRKTGRGLSEIVVFKPSAIKHRDAERFDPNDPNIYHARGGVAK